MDPLRVRVRFMRLLSQADRLAVVRDARTKLKEHIRVIAMRAQEDRRNNDAYRYLAHRNAILSIRAQLDWLDEVESIL